MIYEIPNKLIHLVELYNNIKLCVDIEYLLSEIMFLESQKCLMKHNILNVIELYRVAVFNGAHTHTHKQFTLSCMRIPNGKTSAASVMKTDCGHSETHAGITHPCCTSGTNTHPHPAVCVRQLPFQHKHNHQ